MFICKTCTLQDAQLQLDDALRSNDDLKETSPLWIDATICCRLNWMS